MSAELQIYFAAAVRGDASFTTLARRIEQLSELGHVLTEHMASPASVDLGHRDDAAIHAHDQALLARAHVFIADVSAPSTGTGYMAARALARGIPVLCLYQRGQRPSAMIAGSPDITTRFYADEADLMHHVRDFLLAHARTLAVTTRARRIFLAGPPGSGKGTLGTRLAERTGAPHISTGEILRALVADQPTHPHAVTIQACMSAGKLVPAEVMRDIVVDRLAQPDCRLFGFILDGYPPSLADLDNLRSRAVEPDIVFYLDCSDATAQARQVSRGARSTDTPEKARDRLAAFHEARAEYDELATHWYPRSLVVRVDAERPPAEVEATVVEILRNTSDATRHERSYFPLAPVRADTVRSTRVHFHVDAPNAAAVRAIAREIFVRHKPAQGQLKIYPIRSLHLGGQMRLPIYRRLPNFHPIDNADHEAFITGRLGDGDRALVQVVLAVTREHGGMAELEEYLGEWTLRRDGSVVADASYELVDLDHTYRDFATHLAPELPAWELHHGFDLPKTGTAEPPLALAELMAACADAGLDNGGWFIFKHDRHWAYRSNEFSNASLDDARARLHAQARSLQQLLAARGIACDIGFSLEKVHGIWTF